MVPSISVLAIELPKNALKLYWAEIGLIVMHEVIRNASVTVMSRLAFSFFGLFSQNIPAYAFCLFLLFLVFLQKMICKLKLSVLICWINF